MCTCIQACTQVQYIHTCICVSLHSYECKRAFGYRGIRLREARRYGENFCVKKLGRAMLFKITKKGREVTWEHILTGQGQLNFFLRSGFPYM